MSTQTVPILLALLVGLVGASPADPRLAKLCDYKEVQLGTVDDLKTIAKVAASGAGDCPPLVVEALRDMNEIVQVEQACTMEKADSITSFVAKYLRRPAGGKELPRSLAEFAVSYGFQVSGVCSREMMDRFGRDASARIHEKLSSREYEKFEIFRDHLIRENPLGVMLRPIVKTGEVILPADLMQLIPDARNIEVKLPENESSDWVKGLCANTLRPMYEPILLPLAHLIRAGFNNAARYKKTADKENGLLWSAAVFLCETLNSVTVESDKHAKVDSELHEAVKGLADSEELKGDDEHVQPVAEARFTYESDSQISGEIVSPSVKSLVKTFDANKNEIDHLRDRIMKRSLKVLKALFSRRRYKSSFREFVKAIKVNGDKDSPKFDKVKASIEELIGSSGENTRDLAAPRKSALAGEHEHKSLAFGFVCLIIFVACFAGCFLIEFGGDMARRLNARLNRQPS